MKLYKFSIVVLALVMSSCGQDLADININPNSSPTARPQEVLTSGIGYYGIALDAYFNEANALYTQYWAGGPGVAILDHERYFFEPGDFNTEWNFTFLQSLSDLDYVIKNGNGPQSGVAQILTAYIYQTVVDQYGDIPYSEANRGAIEDGAILTPKYDDAKTIYADLLVKLDAGIAKLGTAGTVGPEDLIYDGDLDKWVKFANSVKLKVLMRQSIVDPSVAGAVRALVAQGNFIESSAEMAAVPFSGETGNLNPSYARRESGIGMFYVASSSFTDLMTSLNDPRLSKLFKVSKNKGTVVGLLQGGVADLVSPTKDDYSFPNTISYDIKNSVILMSPWEVMFLRAEADMRFGTADDDVDMLNKAVTAHFAYVGASGAAAYLSTEVGYSPSKTVTEKSRIIGIQKWIAMCGLQETEGYIEAKRFDTAEDRIFSDAGKGIYSSPPRTVIGANNYPNARLYPQSELSFNPNSPKGRKVTDKVFWDN